MGILVVALLYWDGPKNIIHKSPITLKKNVKHIFQVSTSFVFGLAVPSTRPPVILTHLIEYTYITNETEMASLILNENNCTMRKYPLDIISWQWIIGPFAPTLYPNNLARSRKQIKTEFIVA